MDKNQLDKLFRDRLTDRKFDYDPAFFEAAAGGIPVLSQKKRRGLAFWKKFLLGLWSVSILIMAALLITNRLDESSDLTSYTNTQNKVGNDADSYVGDIGNNTDTELNESFPLEGDGQTSLNSGNETDEGSTDPGNNNSDNRTAPFFSDEGTTPPNERSYATSNGQSGNNYSSSGRERNNRNPDNSSGAAQSGSGNENSGSGSNSNESGNSDGTASQNSANTGNISTNNTGNKNGSASNNSSGNTGSANTGHEVDGNDVGDTGNASGSADSKESVANSNGSGLAGNQSVSNTNNSGKDSSEDLSDPPLASTANEPADSTKSPEPGTKNPTSGNNVSRDFRFGFSAAGGMQYTPFKVSGNSESGKAYSKEFNTHNKPVYRPEYGLDFLIYKGSMVASLGLHGGSLGSETSYRFFNSFQTYDSNITTYLDSIFNGIDTFTRDTIWKYINRTNITLDTTDHTVSDSAQNALNGRVYYRYLEIPLMVGKSFALGDADQIDLRAGASVGFLRSVSGYQLDPLTGNMVAIKQEEFTKIFYSMLFSLGYSHEFIPSLTGGMQVYGRLGLTDIQISNDISQKIQGGGVRLRLTYRF